MNFFIHFLYHSFRPIMKGTKDGKVKPKSSRKSLSFLQPAPPGSPPKLQKAAGRYITVEPILMLMALGNGVLISLLPQFYRYTIAMEMNVTLPDSSAGENSSCVGRNISNPYYVKLQDVQAEVAYWQMVIGLCGSIPSLIVSPFLGAWSDLVGRKYVFALIVIGNAVHISTLIAVNYLTLPLWILAISNFVTGKFTLCI